MVEAIRAAIASRAITPAELRARLEAPAPRAANQLAARIFGITDPPESTTTIPYAPTPVRAILDVIDHLPVTREDTFVDLGAGLGHVVHLVAFLTGARSIGIEIDPAFVARAEAESRALAIDATFVTADVFDADLSAGTTFFLFAPLPEAESRAVIETRLAPLAEARPIRLATFAMSELGDLGFTRLVPSAPLSAGLALFAAPRR